jgi:spore coat protein JB
MPNTPNAGTVVSAVNTSYMPFVPNSGAMPKHNNLMAPEMTAKPNMGAMPEMTAKPNMGAMPEMTAKPNMGMMPEMAAKPNMGLMPEMNAKPNIGAMPEMTAKPNMRMMPEMTAKPNMRMMPEMTAKPNMGAMPYTVAKPTDNIEADKSGCGYKNGELPPCAPLSVGFIPFQQKNPPKYESEEALTRGTLFPGLDLPWNNIVNKSHPYAGTPKGELMALGFVIKELNLYLDTHPNDKEALDMLISLNKLMQEGQERFVRLFGPQRIMDITSGDEYTWINDPWPWEYTDKGGSDNNV